MIIILIGASLLLVVILWALLHDYFKNDWQHDLSDQHELLEPAAIKSATPLLSVPSTKNALRISSKDIQGAAGEDVVATYLDLAYAYIETGRHALAVKMLQHIADSGTEQQQLASRQLLDRLMV